MFAVPGWSVSADNLRVENAASKKDTSGSAKKRKRSGRDSQVEKVTTSNVADLYETVIEGKLPQTKKRNEPSSQAQQQGRDGQAPKRQKKGDHGKQADTKDDHQRTGSHDGKSKLNKKKEKKAQKGENRSGNKDTVLGVDSKALPGDSTETAIAKTAPLAPAPPKLTPLQASMREKLISARFRHLNETLYTRPSEEAFKLFIESPEMFDEYHEGFRRQVKVWPENPVDSFLRDVRARGAIKTQPKGKPGGGNTASRGLAATVLPRTAGTCTIADLGCGDARLAELLSADKSKMRLELKSYDLQSPSPWVTKADIADLPLEDGSVNVAIFCLALMGTNWIDFVEEAYRILHWKGELWVAEIKSRFGPARQKNAPVTHSVGNRKKLAKKGKGASEEDGNDGEDLAVEVDGAEDKRRETDVSAFVEVLKKRGFVLQGERSEAIDLSNRMFVKMHFSKGASPTKGKGVKAAEPVKGKKEKIRWQVGNETDGREGANEAAVLKPCVYKIR